MEFPGFLGNAPVKEALSQAFSAGRFPHALLLQGEPGVGKRAFARLLAYLAELLEAQALAGPELLARAARCPAFSACCPAGTAALSALRPPDCLPDALCREIAETLAAAEESPRLTACAALRRLAALCEAEADELAARAHDARRLWPRLGGCLGVLAAILLW